MAITSDIRQGSRDLHEAENGDALRSSNGYLTTSTGE